MIRRVASIPEPTSSAVSLIDMKDHLRITDTYSDVLIENISVAATSYVEKWTQRLLTPRAAVLRLSATPAGVTPIDLPGGVVNSITSLTVDGVVVAGLTVVGSLVVPTDDWPVAVGEGYPVVVTYNVGYSAIPGPLANAVKLYGNWLYDQTDTQDAMISQMMPYRIRPL